MSFVSSAGVRRRRDSYPPGSPDFRDGWYCPGEIGSLDADGFHFLHGRSSELIFRVGAKIAPTEIEAVLQSHAQVVEAAVVGRRQADNEQEAVAYVVVDCPATIGELVAHCRSPLPAYKVPRTIVIVPALPRLPSGKIDRRALSDG